MSSKTQVPHTMDDFSAGRAVAGFERTRTGMWIGVSALLHAVLIFGTSMGYIRDHWIDPAGAEDRKAKAAQAAAAAKAGPATQPTTKPAAGKPAAPGAKPGPNASEKDLLEANKNAPVVKRSTEAAKPEEIPSKPDELGISLDETNGPGGKKR